MNDPSNTKIQNQIYSYFSTIKLYDRTQQNKNAEFDETGILEYFI